MHIRFWPQDEARRELDEDGFGACTQRARIVLGLWRLGDPNGRTFSMVPYRPGSCCAAAMIGYRDRHRDVADLEAIARVHRFELEAVREPSESLRN